MFNRGKFNLKRFDVAEKPTDIQIRECMQELIESEAVDLILTVPETVAAEETIGAFAAVRINTYKSSIIPPFNLQRLQDILAESGFEAAYDHFISKPALPFLLFMRQRAENLYADDRVFTKSGVWQIYLVTELKSTQAEQAVEKALDDNGICWEVVDEFFDKEERVYQTIYEFTEVED